MPICFPCSLGHWIWIYLISPFPYVCWTEAQIDQLAGLRLKMLSDKSWSSSTWSADQVISAPPRLSNPLKSYHEYHLSFPGKIEYSTKRQSTRSWPEIAVEVYQAFYWVSLSRTCFPSRRTFASRFEPNPFILFSNVNLELAHWKVFEQ